MSTASVDVESTVSFTVSVADLRRESAPLVATLKHTHATIPVIGQILLDFRDGILNLHCTTLDLYLSCSLPASGVKPCRMMVPPVALAGFLEHLDCQSIEMSHSGDCTMLTAGARTASISTMSASNFPKIPIPPSNPEISIDQAIINRLVRRTIFAVSNEESRYTLSAAMVDCNGASVKMIATDGHRLALCKTTEFSGQPTSFLLNIDALERIEDMFGASGPIHITSAEDFIHLSQGGRHIAAKAKKLQWPKYEPLIPATFAEPTATVCSDVLLSVLQTADHFADERSNCVKLTIADGTLTVKAGNAQISSFGSSVAAKCSNATMTIALCNKYLMDFLRNNPGQIEIHLTDAEHFCLLKPAEADDYLYLIMPMRT